MNLFTWPSCMRPSGIVFNATNKPGSFLTLILSQIPVKFFAFPSVADQFAIRTL